MDVLIPAKNQQQIIIEKNSKQNLSDFKGETTTISTITVRAEPHSTLVVALLKVIIIFWI